MPSTPYYLFPITLAHTIFCLAFLLTKRKKGAHDLIGSIWILLVFLSCVRRALHLNDSHEDWNWFLKIISYPLAYGPCLYLYTATLVKEGFVFRAKHTLHFFPFVFFSFVSYVPGIETETYRIDLKNSASWYSSLINGVAVPLSIVSYSWISFRLIRKHANRVRDFFSYEDLEITLRWLIGVCILFLTILFVQTSFLVLKFLSEPPYTSPRLTNGFMVGFLFLLSFFILRQKTVFSENTIRTRTENNGDSEKYSKSRLESERMTRIADELIRYMEHHKPYLRDDLGIQEIAQALQISTNHLSQALNLHLGKNFFTLTNEYRIEEVKQRLKDSEFKDYPVLRIGLECGFNSKSSFYSVFRKMTGQRPGEYKRE
ncbi:AraC family transcriptional regulator [Leptospira gomenensis]|uniref:AraC family transcriptional regulator n=1 Tax=Leptospira gomenensis TaxID=2484974 RepID=A0A5F1YE72_9LEPT|nr:AraC family transcriptional regulator [Leptospira gomenensis]TGK37434.1 AraC family transcriptional regulator [Leptospira gomenensis]TGK40793.1 AraC family transcriptional regulator [Leptospira gomenensis]TGK43019.1 AraC family transcriptional regulator [Leptospira gomenensis]TGK54281.1 AraC family transcriptional regulator [Leptospira gomenensis]